MRSCIVFLGVALLSLMICSSATAGETYFKFEISEGVELQKLTRVISIDNVKGTTVFAYANDRELADFELLGYDYEVLPHPGSLIQPRMAVSKDGMKDWDAYPTYEGYVSMMYGFAADYPSLCEIHNIGYSVEGREILYVKISDNVGIEEAEPEVMFTGTMHGDETTGYVLLLRLIDSLLTSYGTDPRITDMVNNMEIWINPASNPDGTYAGGNSSVSGATRYNANWVDLNRNFPDAEDGPHPDGNSWQIENIAQMDFADAHSLVISANLHGGTEVINYPWDTWSRRHVDDQWFQDVSHAFADTAQTYSPSGYMTGYDDGITNGYDWYSISGGRQDYMNYWRGCREVTAEISDTKLLPASQLPAHWEYNKRSFLQWFENAYYGIRGIVTDAQTGDPVAATITVLDHDLSIDSSRVFTDPDVGDYYRMIEAGTYDVQFSAYGYVTQTIQDIFIADGSTHQLNVQLEPLADEPSLEYVSNDAPAVMPGDNVSMSVSLANYGGGNATGVMATLTTSDTYISMVQGTSSFPMIAKLGGSAASSSRYSFTVSSDCPLYHTVNFTLIATADGGYADTMYFDILVGQQSESFESGDFASYPWSMSGDQSWTITSSTVYEGAYSAKSGSITHSQSTTMQVTMDVMQAGDISFYYKVSSESGWDYLQFFIDTSTKGEWSGEQGWAEASYAVTPGQHTFKWTYYKDGSYTSGSDCGWIDNIIFPMIGAPVSIVTSILPDWTHNVPYSQQLDATGGSGGYTWSDPSGDLLGTGLSISAGGLVSGTPTSVGEISFTAHVEDNGGSFDDNVFLFSINEGLTITGSTLPDGEVNQPYSEQLGSIGGTGVKTWTDANGGLSGTGLAVSTAGEVSGTPTTQGQISFLARVEDEVGASAQRLVSLNIAGSWICGDADASGAVDIDDAVFLIGYIFSGGTAPDPLESGDVDCSGAIDIDDAVYLIAYIFSSGPEPCAGC